MLWATDGNESTSVRAYEEQSDCTALHCFSRLSTFEKLTTSCRRRHRSFPFSFSIILPLILSLSFSFSPSLSHQIAANNSPQPRGQPFSFQHCNRQLTALSLRHFPIDSTLQCDPLPCSLLSDFVNVTFTCCQP